MRLLVITVLAPLAACGGGGAAAPDAPPALLCEPAHGPVTPVATDDATYTTWTELACLADACLCSDAAHDFLARLLACDAVEGGYWWGLGSVYVHVVGRDGGACVIDVGGEVEGGVQVSRCTLPLPITPWSGLARTDGAFLDGIEDACTATAQCNLLLDDCPPGTPLCPPGQLACE